MNWLASDGAMVRRLIVKDWQVYQKQLAGFVGGLLLALGLVGMGTPLMSAAGLLLLLILLLVVGQFAIQSSVMAERRGQTQPFVLSLPVTPMDLFWSKLLANLAIYLLPFVLVVGGLLALTLATPAPDGGVPWLLLVAGFMLANFVVALCVALAVDSEGWNVFAGLALMSLIGPFLWWVTQLDGIRPHLQGEAMVFTGTFWALLAGEAAVIVVAILACGWAHARKPSFL